MYKYFIALLILLIIFLLKMREYYNRMISTVFCNNNLYDYLIKFIQKVSKNNYYMNYGLWDKKHNTLLKANKNLCNFIYSKAKLKNGKKVLDVGSGYGRQDFHWSKKTKNKLKIWAVDISDTQIENANKLKKKLNNTNIEFIKGDAHKLLELKNIGNQKFDRIISLESAFHYKDRDVFFNNVAKLLDKDGIFIISDIVFNDEYIKNGSTIFSNIFLKFACDFLCFPIKNLISKKEWCNQIERKSLDLGTPNLKIVELYDITSMTFNPYYEYFFKIYIKSMNLPDLFSKTLYYIFFNIQPFSYNIAVCKREN